MMTFDQALLHLIRQGKVSVEDAMQAVSSVHDFELALQQAGIPIPSRPPAADAAPAAPVPTPDTATPGATPETTAPAGVADVLGGAPAGVEVPS